MHTDGHRWELTGERRDRRGLLRRSVGERMSFLPNWRRGREDHTGSDNFHDVGSNRASDCVSVMERIDEEDAGLRRIAGLGGLKQQRPHAPTGAIGDFGPACVASEVCQLWNCWSGCVSEHKESVEYSRCSDFLFGYLPVEGICGGGAGKHYQDPALECFQGRRPFILDPLQQIGDRVRPDAANGLYRFDVFHRLFRSRWGYNSAAMQKNPIAQGATFVRGLVFWPYCPKAERHEQDRRENENPFPHGPSIS
jgi:hypothetical protein